MPKFIFYTLFLGVLMMPSAGKAASLRTLSAEKPVQHAYNFTANHLKSVHISVKQGSDTTTLKWPINRTKWPVLLAKLKVPNKDHIVPYYLYDPRQNHDIYEGVLVTFTPHVGKPQTLHVTPQDIQWQTGPLAKHSVRKPFQRDLEYWLLGTAPTRGVQLQIAQLIPVNTFSQCLQLNNMIISTSPRQCVLPNNNILLETEVLPLPETLTVNSFDACLKDGKALINTFPRRCLVEGGRVFTELPTSRR